MPTQIAELPKVERGRTSKYDFDALYDGNVYVLTQGSKEEVEDNKADFSCKPASFRQTVYTDARSKGHALVTRNIEHDGRPGIAVQVTGPYVPKDERENGDKPASSKGKQSAKTAA
jgi:hypothetical protein